MRTRLALAALLVAGAAGANLVRSSDGTLALEPPPGWEALPPPSEDTLLSLRKGRSTLILTREPGLPSDGLKARLAEHRASLRRKGLSPGRSRRVTIGPDGEAWSSVVGGGEGARVGYLRLGTSTYGFSGRRLADAELAAVLGALRPAPPTRDAPGPAPGVPEFGPGVEAFGGKLRLASAEGWRVAEAEGWVTVEGPGLSLALSEREIPRLAAALPRQPPPEPGAVISRFFDEFAAGLPRGCAGTPPRVGPLVNGWQLLYRQFDCPPEPGPRLRLAGLVIPTPTSVYALRAGFEDPSRLEHLLSWLARCELGSPTKALAPAPRPRARAPRLPVLPLAGLAAFIAAVGLGVSLVRGRGALVENGRSIIEHDTAFPIRARRRYRSLGRVYEVQDSKGARFAAGGRYWPGLAAKLGAGLYLSAALALALGEAAGLGGSGQLASAAGLAGLAGLASLTVAGAVALYAQHEIELLGSDGAALYRIRTEGWAPLGREAVVEDGSGNEVARMRRAGPKLLRRVWDLLDRDGKAYMVLRERRRGRIALRRLFGHLWGLWRGELELAVQGRRVGMVERGFDLRDNFTLRMVPDAERAIDPRLVLAAVVFVLFRDPDQPFPWL